MADKRNKQNEDGIKITGAKENNLKNVSVFIPRNKMTVMTGLSGSGKSSLAFDTIYAEGQRRYVESLSSYARMFLGQMDKPNVEKIEGLSPAISIDQKTTSHNPRSTVGTVTEIYDYLRLMFARIGVPHCPECGRPIYSQTIDQVVDAIMERKDEKLQIMAPIVRSRKGEHVKLIEDMGKQGFVRVRVDGTVYEIGDDIKIEKNKKHNIEVVVDRIKVREGIESRLTDSLETAFKLADNLVIINNVDTGEDTLYSQNYACTHCNINIQELSPRMFSFNSPFGACEHCLGLGVTDDIDEDLVVPDKSKSLNQGALQISGWSMKGDSMARAYLEGLAKELNFDFDTPFEKLSKEVQHAILYGWDKKRIRVKIETANGIWDHKAYFTGVIPTAERRRSETHSESQKQYYSEFVPDEEC
ncbi:MAG: excinuclease ABC subunit UvrA, partial [Clostridia bacterium]|nr:excinuclease ABC subunit UvrA [Clostridia bacterium]